MKPATIRLVLLLLASCFVAGGAMGQFSSSRPVRILVSAAAGGPTDIIARMVGQGIAPTLGNPVVVESLPSANFQRVFREISGAPPDGFTLLLTPTSAVVAQLLHPKDGFSLADMSPVTLVATGPLVLVGRKGGPINTVADMVDYARRHPNQLTVGVPGGTGSSFYLALALLLQKTGITVIPVPFNGSAQSLNALLGGHIDVMFDAMPTMTAQIKSGSVTPIAITSLARDPALPDVATAAEQGISDYDVAGWFGILAPPSTPLAIRKRYRDEIAGALQDPAAISGLAQLGVSPVANQPEEWLDFLKREISRWDSVIKVAGIKPD